MRSGGIPHEPFRIHARIAAIRLSDLLAVRKTEIKGHRSGRIGNETHFQLIVVLDISAECITAVFDEIFRFQLLPAAVQSKFCTFQFKIHPFCNRSGLLG